MQPTNLGCMWFSTLLPHSSSLCQLQGPFMYLVKNLAHFSVDAHGYLLTRVNKNLISSCALNSSLVLEGDAFSGHVAKNPQ